MSVRLDGGQSDATRLSCSLAAKVHGGEEFGKIKLRSHHIQLSVLSIAMQYEEPYQSLCVYPERALVG